MRRTLVAGIGNIFCSDDGFGVEVVRRLADTDLPEGVKVADIGIRGMHLAYELMDGYDLAIFVDALARGEPAGTVTVLEPDVAQRPAGDTPLPVVDSHSMQPAAVLDLVEQLGGTPGRVLIVGCEPATTEEGIGLSPPVAAAVDIAVARVRGLLSAAHIPPDPARSSGGPPPRGGGS